MVKETIFHSELTDGARIIGGHDVLVSAIVIGLCLAGMGILYFLTWLLSPSTLALGGNA